MCLIGLVFRYLTKITASRPALDDSTWTHFRDGNVRRLFAYFTDSSVIIVAESFKGVHNTISDSSRTPSTNTSINTNIHDFHQEQEIGQNDNSPPPPFTEPSSSTSDRSDGDHATSDGVSVINTNLMPPPLSKPNTNDNSNNFHEQQQQQQQPRNDNDQPLQAHPMAKAETELATPTKMKDLPLRILGSCDKLHRKPTLVNVRVRVTDDLICSFPSWPPAVHAFVAPAPRQGHHVGVFDVSKARSIQTWTNRRSSRRMADTRQRHDATARGMDHEEAEVVVIGSGIAGLCTAALLSSYGKKVVVCESHTQPGGCAHGFDRSGYKFDSGPSLFSGMSISPTPNPLKHVLNAIGEDVEWLTYDTWGVTLPEGYFDNAVGPEPFRETISRFGGPGAQAEWDRLTEHLLELSECTMGLPPFSLRIGPGAVLTMAQFLPTLVKVIKAGPSLQDPFTEVLEKLNVNDPFVKNWLNLLCFLLQGLPSDGTSTAVMAYMIADWCRPGVVLDYPKGGTEALVDALVRGVEKKGGKVMLAAHVEEVVVEDGRACGVRLRGGKVVRATRSVVSNASIWDTLRLVPKGALPEEFVKEREATPQCKSFMHVHLGVRCHDLIEAAAKGGGDAFNPRCHYAVVADWEKPIDAAGNVIVVSIPSVLDPSLAPPGCHAVHAYTAGCEPFSIWEGLDPKSEKYRKLKEERAQVLMDAVEVVFPKLETRLDVRMIGTPLTAQRFLRRDRGTYGPEIKAGRDSFAGPNTPLKGLVCTGDSVWPGIGVPAVAASGTLVANMMVNPFKQLKMLRSIDFGGVGVNG